MSVCGWGHLLGERGSPEKREQQVNSERADHDEHHILANTAGLQGGKTQAERINPGSEQVDETIDKRAIGDEVPGLGEPDAGAGGAVEEAVDPALVERSNQA